ncbi:transposase [Streptomyces sp. NPDC005780]|uniref:transposase n=1 Tax=Streptomyces sp. NPDC005780 TaxID=3364730 RepID=UPI00367AE2C7
MLAPPGQKAGLLGRPHRIRLAELGWSRACVDGPTSARIGGPDTGAPPVGQRRTGSNHQLICDGRGTPLRVITTAANVNDVSLIRALLHHFGRLAVRWNATPNSTTPSSPRLQPHLPQTPQEVPIMIGGASSGSARHVRVRSQPRNAVKSWYPVNPSPPQAIPRPTTAISPIMTRT